MSNALTGFNSGKAVVFVLAMNFLLACQQSPDSRLSNLETTSLNKNSTEMQIVIEGQGHELTDEYLKSNQGQKLNKLEHFEASIAKIPRGLIAKMKIDFPNLKIYEDIQMSFVDDVEQLAPQKGGGGSTPPPPQVLPWGVKAIKADQAHQLGFKGAGAVVCVVDSGVDTSHVDLASNIVGGRNYVALRGLIDPQAYNDDNGHGTHVAGSIAAIDNSIGSIGVAPQSRIYGVKVLDKRGSGSLSAVADGIRECILAKSQVINLSLGASGDPNQDTVLKQAIDAAILAGLTVVAAAGNEGQPISGKIPAGYSGVIAVSAFDSNLAFPSWSNFGLGLDDFAAPGVAIYSLWKANSFNTISGTSMAAPHVAGVAALKIAAGITSNLRAVSTGKGTSIEGAGSIDALLSLGL